MLEKVKQIFQEYCGLYPGVCATPHRINNYTFPKIRIFRKITAKNNENFEIFTKIEEVVLNLSRIQEKGPMRPHKPDINPFRPFFGPF